MTEKKNRNKNKVKRKHLQKYPKGTSDISEVKETPPDHHCNSFAVPLFIFLHPGSILRQE